MKHPPYHLRPNKAIDRLAFIAAIRHLERFEDISGYTYYGMGGPYLEDFKLLYEYFPELKLVSIERSAETLKRQEFHRPCADHRLKLQGAELKAFLSSYKGGDEKAIFWLDYTNLEYPNIEDFMMLLGKVGPNSVIKITLRARPNDYFRDRHGGADGFRRRFSDVMPDPLADPPESDEDFAALIQSMLRVASQKALPANAFEFSFFPLASFYYADMCQMYSLTGIVCDRKDETSIRKAFGSWEFSNLDWGLPRKIDVPFLSTKERMNLQSELPGVAMGIGRALRLKMGYEISEDEDKTESQLEQYANYHKHFPYFMKAVP